MDHSLIVLDALFSLASGPLDGPRTIDTSAASLKGLVSVGDLDRLISIAGMKLPFVTMVNASTNRRPWNIRGLFDGLVGRANPLDLVREFGIDRSTLVFPHAHRTLAPIGAIARLLSSRIDPMAVQCNAYLSPPRAVGVGPHVDQHHTLLAQISGHKRWRVWKNIDPNPAAPMIETTEAQALHVAELESPILDIMLQEGQILLIPRGFVHCGSTCEHHSLHITFGVIDPTPSAAACLRYRRQTEFFDNFCAVL